MEKNKIETHLVVRQSKFPTVCISCNKTIGADEIHYVEEGKSEHLHSLIARKFCPSCYAKYGEQILLKGPEK
ncbi:MAG: hypothetical protein QHH19_01290 [Candidatus Thermoplasmatota archaeon]|jgi:hypothetical protein|nr:hypothetical protein [Candidatus Thermoplasmatota archaeon]MDH7516969.1 hypothetical protein [Candidatus Thermoplasmatota archaeon]